MANSGNKKTSAEKKTAEKRALDNTEKEFKSNSARTNAIKSDPALKNYNKLVEKTGGRGLAMGAGATPALLSDLARNAITGRKPRSDEETDELTREYSRAGAGSAKMKGGGGVHRMPDGTMMKDSEHKGMRKGGSTSKWIQKAIKKPGALRKSLGVKKGEKIPAAKLASAAKKPGKLGQRARLAATLKGFKK